MTVMYEAYEALGSSGIALLGSGWYGQTFTPVAVHTLSSIRIQLYRDMGATSGVVTVGLRITSGTGTPNASDWCAGTLAASSVGTVSPGQYYDLSLGGDYALSSATTYAIVVRNSATGGATVYWWQAASGASYVGGIALNSSDGGSTWGQLVGQDFYFETWGSPIAVEPYIIVQATHTVEG